MILFSFRIFWLINNRWFGVFGMLNLFWGDIVTQRIYDAAYIHHAIKPYSNILVLWIKNVLYNVLIVSYIRFYDYLGLISNCIHYLWQLKWHIIWMAHCKVDVTPLLMHWNYCRLTLSHRYVRPLRVTPMIVRMQVCDPAYLKSIHSFTAFTGDASVKQWITNCVISPSFQWWSYCVTYCHREYITRNNMIDGEFS